MAKNSGKKSKGGGKFTAAPLSFGGNIQAKGGKGGKKPRGGRSGSRSNAWRAYVGGVSNAPLPD